MEIIKKIFWLLFHFTFCNLIKSLSVSFNLLFFSFRIMIQLKFCQMSIALLVGRRES